MKTETQLMLEIGDYLKSMGYFFWRNNNTPVMGRFNMVRSMPRHSQKGVPDILMLHDGLFIGIEAKRPKAEGEREKNGRTVRAGTLTKEQIVFGERLKKNGGAYWVISDLAQLKDLLLVLWKK